MKSQTLFLELNEVSFEYVASYCARGLLPNFKKLIDSHGVRKTISNEHGNALEPWIQWVTAHTGLSLAEHGVFRLGDIVQGDLRQIWEALEDEGLRVGAISPMNAKHRLKKPAFFVPDPWTATRITGRPTLVNLYNAIAQAVNDNAQAKVTRRSIAGLAVGIARYARLANYLKYLKLALRARSKPWQKAMFLDLLLADVFVHEVRQTRPDFATLFLNAAAHIQHHYLFSSSAYTGTLRNPEWYAPDGADPVLDVYQGYDQIIGDVLRKFPSARLMLATGLHQVPHSKVTYYWRLKDHATFLRNIGVIFDSVEPRMSRDFRVAFSDPASAKSAEELLLSARSSDGDLLFEVDNRGSDLFVMLVYSRDITPEFEYFIGSRQFAGFAREVAFVALKNGEHHGDGYFIDTALRAGEGAAEFSLREVPHRVATALGVVFHSPSLAPTNSAVNA